MQELRIGLVGLDTSHAPTFTKLLNDASHPHHVEGGRVVAAFPGGSSDFGLSWSRVESFTAQVRDEGGVAILDSPSAVAESCDAVILCSADGRVHFRQFQEIASFAKPVFIDKPLATSYDDACAIAALAAQNNVVWMSTSALRYAQPLVAALAAGEMLMGADCSGPMEMELTQPGLFWYGIHSVEMLYTAMGRDCKSVTAVSTHDSEFVTAIWNDGRIGTVRGYRSGKQGFGALLHESSLSHFVDAMKHPQPVYVGLLQSVLEMFHSGKAPVAIEETLEIVRFIEAANLSRHSGESVLL